MASSNNGVIQPYMMERDMDSSSESELMFDTLSNMDSRKKAELLTDVVNLFQSYCGSIWLNLRNLASQ